MLGFYAASVAVHDGPPVRDSYRRPEDNINCYALSITIFVIFFLHQSPKGFIMGENLGKVWGGRDEMRYGMPGTGEGNRRCSRVKTCQAAGYSLGGR